ncbi:phosphotransferase [Neiella marina]|uniref:Phosphotransferase n=1 Tax=Neiella marina TaxID=508461 RepID=A0A8J2U462_9GAMM|nr:phosphotransferase [Neiella marina]GGA73601.1 phosphotransferase [Neiella marina]
MQLTPLQQDAICRTTQCQRIEQSEIIQSLWAGQGALARLTLRCDDGVKQSSQTLVVKQIRFQSSGEHPRGWNTQRSQQRKRQSYEVELHWYRHFETLTQQAARIPKMLYSELTETGALLVMEDLAVDFPIRFTGGKNDRPNQCQIEACIRWLAAFHALFVNCPVHEDIGDKVSQLWQCGGYWHLDTRPDEWQAMADGQLKQAAVGLDLQLRQNRYQTLIHGDAKLANFCFKQLGNGAAAVDFQYVGQGLGVQDLMLLLSSVMPDRRLLTEADDWVDYYFQQLKAELTTRRPEVDGDDVIRQWRSMYAVAWADFHRFLAGWSPGHWKIGEYCRQQTQLALTSVNWSTNQI